MDFIEVIEETKVYTFDRVKYRVSNNPTGDIEVFEYYYGNDDGVALSKNNWEYWVGALIAVYENVHDNSWATEDYWRAAQVCHRYQVVLDANVLEHLIGYKSEWGQDPDDYETVMRRCDLKDEADSNNQKFREGAD